VYYIKYQIYLLDICCITGYLFYCVLLYCVLCNCCTVGIDVFTLLLARSQYSEVPATGHLDTGFFFLVFPCL
jgi:hypothetical protein